MVLCPQCTTNISAHNYSGPPEWVPFGRYIIIFFKGINDTLSKISQKDYSWLCGLFMAILICYSTILQVTSNLFASKAFQNFLIHHAMCCYIEALLKALCKYVVQE